MKLPNLVASLVCAGVLNALPTSSAPNHANVTRADSSLVGYLGAFFLGNEPSIYFYLSNGNDALSFKSLNGGAAILRPTTGTGGVRDPSLIDGGGNETRKKWYIIGTDLDIAKTTWNDAVRTGSRSIYIWDSDDLINWGVERLIEVENEDAGMVWAPDAIWDAEKGQYLVHWSSRFYAANDPGHTGTGSATKIRYAYTSDFQTFSEPRTLIDYSPTSIIDLAYIKLPHISNSSYARFIKNESDPKVWMERSDDGLFGTWTRSGGSTGVIREHTEGPYAYSDNTEPGKVILLLDYYATEGYRPFTSTDLNSNIWNDADRTNFPSNLRHGSVIGITQEKYSALDTAWSRKE